MKRLIISLFITFMGTILYSQAPFVQYQSVPRQGQKQGQTRTYNYQQQQQPRFYTIAGYYYDTYSENFKRIRIKVNTVSNGYGRPAIYLRGVYNAMYDIWSDCNTLTTKVEAYLDGELIANNFEWKVQALNIGTIYFNYE